MTRFRRFVSVVTMTLSVVVCAATTIAAILPAAALFADAQAKERAVRRALSDPRPNPSVLKAVRTVVAEYESVVRHYPGTPYCDDALWNAAQLSLEAYRKFGQGPDATAATRLFKRLSSEYPTSQWARQARNQSVPTATAASGRPRVPPQPSSPTIAPQGPVLAAVVASKSEPTKPESPKAEPTRAVAEETGTPRSVPVSASIEEPAPIVRASEPHPEPTPTLVSIRAVSPATITRIERSALPDIVRLTIWVSAEVTYREERLTGPPRLFFDFAGTRPSTTLMDRTLSFAGDGDIIREVRVGRHPPQITRVVLDTAGTSDCNVYPLYAPYRVVVDCVRAAGSGPSRLTPPPRAPIVTGTAAAGRSTWPAVPTEVAAAPLVPLVARRSALPLATLPGMAERTVTVSGLSKTFSITGWRVGTIVAPPDLTDAIRKVHDFLTVGSPAPLQEACAVGLDELGPDYYASLAAGYAARGAMLLGALRDVGFRCAMPEGAYYILADFGEISDEDDTTFAKRLAREARVASVPGSSFFSVPERGRSLIRFAFCKKFETLEEAGRRLREFARRGG